MKTFRDEVTNEPVIESINRSNQIFSKGKGIDKLPDTLVKWKFKPAASYRRITSKKYGSIEWPLPGKNPDGRSSNHRLKGF